MEDELHGLRRDGQSLQSLRFSALRFRFSADQFLFLEIPTISWIRLLLLCYCFSMVVGWIAYFDYKVAASCEVQSSFFRILLMSMVVPLSFIKVVSASNV